MADIQCDCSIDHDMDVPVYRDKIIKARKLHKCCECQSNITIGQHYERVIGMCDGHWFSVATCLPCLAIRLRYSPNGWIFGELRDHLEDCLGFDYLSVPEYDNDQDGTPLYPDRVIVSRETQIGHSE